MTKHRKLNKIIAVFITIIMTACSLTGLLNFFSIKTIDYASAANLNGSTDISLTNPNFASDTSTTNYPLTPTGYTPSQSIDSANVKAGVINLTHEDYSSFYKDDRGDNYVLMIDANDHAATFGYKTDNSITLSAGSNYSISVDVLTTNNSGIGALYLFNEDNSIYASIKNISSPNLWTTYTFFITTNNITSLNLKLGMYIDGKAGIILFDSVHAQQLNAKTLNSRMKNLNTSLFTYSNEVKNLDTTNTIDIQTQPFSGYAFEMGKDLPAYTMGGYVNNTSDSEASDGKSDFAFRITNNLATYAQYATADDAFTFKRNTVYKLTISVKAIDLSGNVNLQMIQTGLGDNETGTNSDIITITSSTNSTIYNNYTHYSFYIIGSPLKDTTYKMIVGLGSSSDSSGSKGIAYFTSIETTVIDYTTYSNASSGSIAQKIDLSADAVADTTIMLANGNFNTLKVSDYNNIYPATPSEWTITPGESNQQYGIVNTADFDELDRLNMSNLHNPGDPDGIGGNGNNILMMYNDSADVLSYTSSTTSISAKSYHKFSIQVQTQNSPVIISLVSTVNNKQVVLSSITVSTGAANWQTITLYIYSGYQALDVAFKLTLDSDAYAYAYFDNAHIDYYTQPTEDEFNAAQTGQYTTKTDLSNVMSAEKNEHYSTPLYFTTTDTTSKAGVVNLDGESLGNYVISNPDHIDNFKSLSGSSRNVLAIRSLEDSFITYTSSLGFKLTSGTYYKISVSVFTQNLQILDTSVDSALKGATINLSGFDETFTAIVSDGLWTTYTFYICPDSDITTYVQLSLGSTSAACTGDVFFGNIEFVDDITESEFNTINANKYTKVVKNLSSTDDTPENEPDDSEPNNNWIYVIPSLLMVAALIIAIVGVLLRKVKFKKPRRKTKNTYDRTKTVSKQVYTRRATKMRDEKLKEVTTERNQLAKERSEFEERYKQNLTKLRELKLSRGNVSEINKLTKETKHLQKLNSNLGIRINRLESDITYIESESYLSTLIKKLATEPSDAENQIDDSKEPQDTKTN